MENEQLFITLSTQRGPEECELQFQPIQNDFTKSFGYRAFIRVVSDIVSGFLLYSPLISYMTHISP